MPSHQSIGPDWFITSAQPTTQDQQYISEHKSVGANIIGSLLVFTHTSTQLKTHLPSEVHHQANILRSVLSIALLPMQSSKAQDLVSNFSNGGIVSFATAQTTNGLE